MTKKSDGSYTDEQRQKAIDRHLKDGWTVARAAKELGVSQSMLYVWIRRFKAGEPISGRPGKPRLGGEPKPPETKGYPKRGGSYWRAKLDREDPDWRDKLVEAAERVERPKALAVLPRGGVLPSGVQNGARSLEEHVRRLETENERLRRAIEALLTQ